MDNEKPAHQVTVNSFYMDNTEVPEEAYRKCVIAERCRAPISDFFCNWGKSENKDHPVNCVDWPRANVYCQWMGKRLPSEAEWEYASRGGHSDWEYPWGNRKATCKRAVMRQKDDCGCGRIGTSPVGSKGAFGFGLEDMAGNVWEWVEDCWHDNYIGSPMDEISWEYENCSQRVLRGGSWGDAYWAVRVSIRLGEHAELIGGGNQYGFRCAKSVEDTTSTEVK